MFSFLTLMQEGEGRGEVGKRERWEKHKVILHVARHDGGIDSS